MASTKQAVFYINGEEYGVDITQVSIIERWTGIDQSEGMSRNVKGTISLRGEVIPVYSLRRKFGLEEKEPDDDTRLLISNACGMQIAYEVDSVRGIIDGKPEQYREMPAIIGNRNTGFMKRVLNLEGNLVILLDPSDILTDKEKDILQKALKKKAEQKESK